MGNLAVPRLRLDMGMIYGRILVACGNQPIWARSDWKQSDLPVVWYSVQHAVCSVKLVPRLQHLD